MKLCAPESTIYKLSWIEVLIPLWISLGLCVVFVLRFYSGIYLLCINVYNMYNDEQRDLENRTTIVTIDTTNETPVSADELDLSTAV